MAVILSLYASFMIYIDVLMHVVVLNKLLWYYAMILAHKFQLVITCKKIQIRHNEKIWRSFW